MSEVVVVVVANPDTTAITMTMDIAAAVAVVVVAAEAEDMMIIGHAATRETTASIVNESETVTWTDTIGSAIDSR